jgi:hypothetical protein
VGAAGVRGVDAEPTTAPSTNTRHGCQDGDKSDAAAFAFTIQATVVKAIQGGARTTRQVADSLNSAGLQPRQGSHWYSASVA